MVKENNHDDGDVKLFLKIIGIASLLKNEPSTLHRSENWPSLWSTRDHDKISHLFRSQSTSTSSSKAPLPSLRKLTNSNSSTVKVNAFFSAIVSSLAGLCYTADCLILGAHLWYAGFSFTDNRKHSCSVCVAGCNNSKERFIGMTSITDLLISMCKFLLSATQVSKPPLNDCMLVS